MSWVNSLSKKRAVILRFDPDATLSYYSQPSTCVPSRLPKNSFTQSLGSYVRLDYYSVLTSSAYQSKLNGSASAPSVAAKTLLNSSKVIVPELSLNGKSVAGSYGGEKFRRE